MKKALIRETFDARDLSMLLMAWALAVAGRFFSEVASTKRPFGSVTAHRVKRIGAIAVLASIAPSLVVWAVIEALLATMGYAGSLSIYRISNRGFALWVFSVGVRPHSGIRRYLAATR